MSSRERRCVLKEAPDFGEQVTDSSAPVVSGHMGVGLEPQAFDPVFVGRVGRQEVQSKPTAPLGQSGLDDFAAVDGVIVEDQVEYPDTAITTQESAQQVQEEPAPFLVALDPNQMPRAMAQGSGQEALFSCERITVRSASVTLGSRPARAASTLGVSGNWSNFTNPKCR